MSEELNQPVIETQLEEKKDWVKKCHKCDTWKNLTEFPNSKMSKDGKTNQCKACFKKMNRANYDKNKVKIIAAAMEWQKNNPAKAKAARKRWLKKKDQQTVTNEIVVNV